MKDKFRNNKGAIMVEAAIYFPIVIFTVFAMIYLGMVKYQESILAFQVEKLAIMGGREIAYPGYVKFTEDGSLQSSAVDFKQESNFSSYMEDYYKGHSEHLYNEWKFNYGQEASRLESELSQMLSQRSFLTGVNSTVKVDISNYVIAKQIKVEATYGFQSPKFLREVGVPVDLTLKTCVKQSAANPVDLVRNVDLAGDLINFLLERFGVKGRVDTFLKKVEDIKNKIL